MRVRSRNYIASLLCLGLALVVAMTIIGIAVVMYSGVDVSTYEVLGTVVGYLGWAFFILVCLYAIVNILG